MNPTAVDAMAIFVKNGLEDIANGAIGLGLHPNRLLVGQVKAKQYTSFNHHLLGPQCGDVCFQVKGLEEARQK